MFRLLIASAKKVPVTRRRGAVFLSITFPIQFRLPKILPPKGYSRVPWVTDISGLVTHQTQINQLPFYIHPGLLRVSLSSRA